MLKWTRQPPMQQHNTRVQQPQFQFQSNQETNISYAKELTPTHQTTFNHTTIMPTMTHTTLERRLHRRSLDNQLDDVAERRCRARHSLTSQANKENFGVHFLRSPCGNTSLTALHDLSNGKSPLPRETPTRTARRQTLGSNDSPLNIKRNNDSNTIPSPLRRAAGRFSDDFADANDATPLSRRHFRQTLRDEVSLSSSRMGDTTLDRMLDAIIESARKDVKCVHQQQQARIPTSAAMDGDEDFEASIHEMEVRTPTHLKRQRVVRRKKPTSAFNAKRAHAENSSPVKTQSTAIHEPSMETLALLAMDTPQHAPCISDDPPNFGKELQRCSTPTLEETQSIKRCLSFSPPSDEEVVDDADYSAAKRSSVASSNASSTGEAHLSASLEGRTSQRSSLKLTGGIKGALDLAIFVANKQLNVHVIRCRELQRANGSTALNAYVKVALIRRPACKNAAEHGFQRTAVHRHSSRPYFDHRFKFDLGQQEATHFYADEERLQLAVWHRDRQMKRSEFLGCISFPLHSLLQQSINGSYKLQSQACLKHPQPAVPTAAATATQVNSHHLQAALLKTHNMATLARKVLANNNTNDDDVTSIDSMALQANALPHSADAHNQPIPLSKKAIHQRDADENLFLRFLELDPLVDETATTTTTTNTTTTTTTTTTNSNSTGAAAALICAANNATGNSNAGGTATRRSSLSKPLGRTPFTMTKKLTRTAERGFGFSIVWTHPPRVEKIEPGLSADRSGILPGDYVIFVDKHNVVTMPEADVLNLIRSQGPTLTLEIFRRSGSGGGAAVAPAPSTTARSTATVASGTTLMMNGRASRVSVSAASNCTAADDAEQQYMALASVPIAAASSTATATQMRTSAIGVRPSTACSGNSSIEAAKRRLNLPQVTFSKESIAPITDIRRRFLLQLISREQNFISALHFGMQRFVQPLLERKDLISPNDHRTLFQNIDELLRISEDVLEQLCNDDQEPQMNFASRVYLSKTTAICAAYKKYCNGIKRADCVLVNKSRQAGSDFIAFLTEPQVPRKRPDLTMLIHRPLQHFREILKLMQLLASNCHVDTEEHKNFSTVINELQAAYREITVSSGLMEPLGEGRPLLTLQDLESRMVFTKCKPFTLAVQGRQWIFGGDLSRVEGRSVKPYWTLLFSDIIVFAKVSRDRVLFITEEPIPIANVVDSCFHMRKKTTEFRLTVDPNGRLAESPTGYCAPDLSRTPKKNARRKSLVLRAPSLELKAVWQNLLQRQIFLVNAALGSTPLSSPLDSPDVLNTLVPLSDIGIATTSIGSIKLSSMDSINIKNQQQRYQQRHSHSLSHPADQIELLIDEKCRILNKTGTPKSSALHLANWMKGQLDKQQEQARLAAERSRENIAREDEHLLYSDSDQDERITYWTRQQLEKRTKELNLIKENGYLKAKPDFGGKRLSGVEELSMSDAYSENVSQISQSHSTTSDSQITVRSSPNVLDKLAVCRHCHKHCQQSQQQQRTSSTSPPALICNSLKVQHSQSSPHRCCRLNGNGSHGGSVTSISSSTVTGEQQSERSSSKHAAITCGESEGDGDTESDVAPLLTDEFSLKSPSEATDDGSALGNRKSSSSGFSGRNAAESDDRQGGLHTERSLSDRFSKIRILDETKQKHQRVAGTHVLHNHGLVNGHVSSGTSSLSGSAERTKPEPPPRRLKIMPKPTAPTTAVHQAKSTVTINETDKVVVNDSVESVRPNTPKSPKTSHSQISAASRSPTQFIACNCDCTPADFEHTTISPDELEQQTCKIIESPKQSPKMPRIAIRDENPHKHCKCVCGKNQSSITSRTPTAAVKVADHADDDDDLSLMLIGLAQFTPATKLLQMSRHSMPIKETAIAFTPKSSPITKAPATTPSEAAATLDANFVPTIAVVPPTPDAVLTKTTTNIWDNSTTMPPTNNQAIQLHINNLPRQPVIEHIPDDSCEDESPLDEEPPYRPMSNALRRYGTMSSLEKLPSDDRMEDGEVDELEDDGDFVDNVADASLANNITDDRDVDMEDEDDEFNDDELEEELKDELEAEFEGAGNDLSLMNSEQEQGVESEASTSSAWTSRAGNYVAGKMSFFEESRAFIDKYLGRWNQEQLSNGAATTQSGNDFDEQLDECTSGATSGEEVWGTPTSGGENDEMHLVNSENTHSSPTKSSTSLNDDDDTELMMDELLMAPPMTASTIRGLLPRRRLEPLFEEETESDEEEKTQQESEELKKGETTTNGHYLADSAGSSSDEDLELDMAANRYEDEEEEEDPTSTEERLLPNLPTTILGPRPLRNPGTGITLPIAVLRGSSCEYLLEQRTALLAASSCSNSSHAATVATARSTSSSNSNIVEQQSLRMTQLTMTELATATPTMTTTLMSSTMTMTQMLLEKKRTHSSITTTTNNASGTTSNSNVCDSSSNTAPAANAVIPTMATATATSTKLQTTSSTIAVVRPAKFIPPPPPPRRLLLTQTNLKTSGNASIAEPQRNFGASADIGSSAAAVAGDAIHRKDSPTQRLAMSPSVVDRTARTVKPPPVASRVAYNIRSSVANTAAVIKRPSSTIIETSLLGQVDNKKPASTSSTTVLTTKWQESQKPMTTTTSAIAAKSKSKKDDDSTSDAAQPPAGSGLSPRLEMRLALNHDILGDEDLICYDPGPDLTTILGHDLSTFQRLTGRDLLHRSATNRVQPREAVISFSQQRNSKMDTPTVNRRPRPSPSCSSLLAASARVGSGSSLGGGVAPQQSHLQPNRNTWSSSAFADRNVDVSASGAVSSDESKLSDLEILARREKIYCMSQSRSGSPAMMMTATTAMKGGSFFNPTMQQQLGEQQLMRTTSITSMGQETDLVSASGSGSVRMRKIGRDETALIEAGKGNRLINFIRRRNSEIPLSPNCSQTSLHESNASSTPERRQVQMSPRKDNDKPSLNRRLWKQITKRRRANSVSEIVAS